MDPVPFLGVPWSLGHLWKRLPTSAEDNALPRRGRALSSAELEKLHRVTGPYPVPLRLRDVGVDFVEERPGIGPFTLDVREVGGEHDAVHAHMLPQFNRHALVLHGEIDVLPHVVAG